MTRGSTGPDAPGENQPSKSGWATVPNLLCATRLVGALGLLALALWDQPTAFLVLFLCLAATDWLDGRLAVWLQQQSSFGARLDSVADAALYGALLLGGLWLKASVLLGELWWIGAALLAYAVSFSVAMIKFRSVPSYHSWIAKFSWLLMLIATITLFVSDAVWPLRIALLVVAIGNIETTLLTLLLDKPRTDVRSVLYVLWRS